MARLIHFYFSLAYQLLFSYSFGPGSFKVNVFEMVRFDWLEERRRRRSFKRVNWALIKQLVVRERMTFAPTCALTVHLVALRFILHFSPKVFDPRDNQLLKYLMLSLLLHRTSSKLSLRRCMRKSVHQPTLSARSFHSSRI